jgi:hypothetical protein
MVRPRYGQDRGPLRWHSQFAPQPAKCFTRFHRVNNSGHALMGVIASRAPGCSYVKAGRSGRRHGCCFARREKWSEEDHNACLRSGGSVPELSVTDGCRDGAVMEHPGTTIHFCAVPFCSVHQQFTNGWRIRTVADSTRGRRVRELSSRQAVPYLKSLPSRRLLMELILIVVILVLLFGGGGYWGRRRGHW